MLKKGTPASPATALLSSVLPVPGGPTSSTPLGMRAPERDELLRVLEELDDLGQLLLGLLHAGHVGEGDGRLVPRDQACARRPKDIAWLLPLWVCRSTYHMKPPINTTRMMFGSRTLSRYCPLLLLLRLILVWPGY